MPEDEGNLFLIPIQMMLLSTYGKPGSLIGLISFNLDDNPMTQAFLIVGLKLRNRRWFYPLQSKGVGAAEIFIQVLRLWRVVSCLPLCHSVSPGSPQSCRTPPELFPPRTLRQPPSEWKNSNNHFGFVLENTKLVCMLQNFPCVNHVLKWWYHLRGVG